MKKSLFITAAGVLAAASIYLAAEEPYERFEHERVTPAAHSAVSAARQNASPAAVTKTAALYQNECSACHMAYQPGLLPKASWSRVMATLQDHFGTDATLEPSDADAISAYLDTHAGNVMPASKHMSRIAKSVSADAPMQITKARYFVKEHRRIPQRYIVQNDVKSLANCNACHTKAESGSYRERGIFIPNYGRWDD
jgi:mono/diheme cytochrome c family protein